MTTPAPRSAAPVGGAGVIETAGIEIIAESERTAKPRDLFWPWFAANVSVFGLSYGSWVLGFGISFWQAALVSTIGIVISFGLCGLIAIAVAALPRRSAPGQRRRGVQRPSAVGGRAAGAAPARCARPVP